MTNPSLRSHPAAAVTPVEWHILLALVGADRHGYDIMRQVAVDSADRIQLGPGTLYGALKRLLERGHIREVEPRVEPGLDDSRRRYYRLMTSSFSALTAEAERLCTLVGLARSRGLLDEPARVRGSRW